MSLPIGILVTSGPGEVHHLLVKWFPPRSFSARYEWGKQHPLAAGFAFATLMFLFSAFLLPALIGTSASIWLRLTVGSITWVGCAVFFPIGMKYRVGERPDAEKHPVPTRRRMWSRTSDRVVFWLLLLGIASFIQSALHLFAGPGHIWPDIVELIIAAWLVGTRRREPRTLARDAED